MNPIAAAALLAAVVILGMQFDGSKDEHGRGFLARIEARDLNKDDRLFLKLEAICLAIALGAIAILGA